MINFTKIILDGSVLSVLASITILGILRFNPRLFLQDYPAKIQEQVPPKDDQEKLFSLLLGIPFLVLLIVVPFLSTLSLAKQVGDERFLSLFINAFGVVFIFNLVDLLILDWLLFCLITPDFLIIPGTKGMQAYKDHRFHFRAFLIGTVISTIAGLGIAGIVLIL